MFDFYSIQIRLYILYRIEVESHKIKVKFYNQRTEVNLKMLKIVSINIVYFIDSTLQGKTFEYYEFEFYHFSNYNYYGIAVIKGSYLIARLFYCSFKRQFLPFRSRSLSHYVEFGGFFAISVGHQWDCRAN